MNILFMDQDGKNTLPVSTTWADKGIQRQVIHYKKQNFEVTCH